MGGLREMAAPFVAPGPWGVAGPLGVAVRDRLRHLTGEDEKVLRLVGDHLGALASRDLKARCALALEHDTEQWAERKRALTQESSSRWAGSVTISGRSHGAASSPTSRVSKRGCARSRTACPCLWARRAAGAPRAATAQGRSGMPRPAACTCSPTGWRPHVPTVKPESCTSCAAGSAC